VTTPRAEEAALEGASLGTGPHRRPGSAPGSGASPEPGVEREESNPSVAAGTSGEEKARAFVH
jgi:hypothetical protein